LTEGATASAELLDTRGDVDRPDFTNAPIPPRLAPAQKLDSGGAVGRARVRIADIDGEEFREARLVPFPAPVPPPASRLPPLRNYMSRAQRDPPGEQSLFRFFLNLNKQ